MLKICIKWPIKPISARLPLTLVLLRISQILTKIAKFLYTGFIKKKTEQILNRPQRREAPQSMKFLINIDCLGTYDVNRRKNSEIQVLRIQGGVYFHTNGLKWLAHKI